MWLQVLHYFTSLHHWSILHWLGGKKNDISSKLLLFWANLYQLLTNRKKEANNSKLFKHSTFNHFIQLKGSFFYRKWENDTMADTFLASVLRFQYSPVSACQSDIFLRVTQRSDTWKCKPIITAWESFFPLHNSIFSFNQLQARTVWTRPASQSQQWRNLTVNLSDVIKSDSCTEIHRQN